MKAPDSYTEGTEIIEIDFVTIHLCLDHLKYLVGEEVPWDEENLEQPEDNADCCITGCSRHAGVKFVKAHPIHLIFLAKEDQKHE